MSLLAHLRDQWRRQADPPRLSATIRVSPVDPRDQTVVAWATYEAPLGAGQLLNVIAEVGLALWCHAYAQVADRLGRPGRETLARMFRAWLDAHRDTPDLLAPGLPPYAPQPGDVRIELSPALPRGPGLEYHIDLREGDRGGPKAIEFQEIAPGDDVQAWIAVLALLEITLRALADRPEPALLPTVQAFAAELLGREPPRASRVNAFLIHAAQRKAPLRPFPSRPRTVDVAPPSPARDDTRFKPPERKG